jgi:ankyrin repeat protein
MAERQVFRDDRNYIDGESGRNVRHISFLPDMRSSLKSRIRFRWAACQLDALKKCIQPRQLRHALASLPETLYDTYANILCGIDQDSTKDALKILQWLAYSARPLRIEEVADVIAVNVKSKPRIDPELILPEPRDILTICSSLVTTNTDATWNSFEKSVGEQIRLAHLSVRDYLTSNQIMAGKAAHYSIDETRAHEAIAEICLAYLLQFDKPDSLSELTANHYHLAQYAAEYWVHHVRASGNETDQIVLLIMELFSNQDTFSNWLRLFDPDKASPEAYGWALPDVAEPLYYASQAGLVEPIKLLLKKGTRVNVGGKLYGRALHAASAGGYHQTVKLLLDEGADINEQSGTHNTALQVASVEGHNTVVRILLKVGAEVNIQGGLYGNALQGASAAGYDEIVHTLINAGANINAKGGEYGTAPLAASFGGYDKIVKSLLDAGADIELPDERGRTALQQAASQGHKSTVQLLIDEGADVNAEDYDRWAPLDEAAPAGFRDIVQLLLDAGSKVVAPDYYGFTALHFTAAQGHTAIVQLLLKKGADANFCDKEKEESSTPLLEAATAGHHETAKALIAGGALVNTAHRNGWTPLHAAIMSGNVPTVRVLLENGVKFTADAEGWTPLHTAVLKGNKFIVELLLINGAEIDAKDEGGKTPMEWAVLRGTDIEGLELKAQSRGKSFLTSTGLRAVAAKGDNLRVRQLLKNGVDINTKDDGGMCVYYFTSMTYSAHEFWETLSTQNTLIQEQILVSMAYEFIHNP